MSVVQRLTLEGGYPDGLWACAGCGGKFSHDEQGSGTFLVHPEHCPEVAAFPGCPTACDSDCEQACHEVHDVPSRREHYPETCVGTIVAAARAQERERIIGLAVRHSATYDETKPCKCSRTRPDGSPCVVLVRPGLPFADLLREGT